MSIVALRQPSADNDLWRKVGWVVLSVLALAAGIDIDERASQNG